MRVELNRETQSAYFQVNKTAVVESEEVSPGIVYDYDKNSVVVGVEILNLSHKAAEQLKQIDLPFSQEDKALFNHVANLFCSRIRSRPPRSEGVLLRESDRLYHGVPCSNSAIATPLIANSLDKGGKLGITVAVLPLNRFTILCVDNLKLACRC
jgi:uncharacterized protein YuzE